MLSRDEKTEKCSIDISVNNHYVSLVFAYITTYSANVFQSPNLHINSFSHKSKTTSREHKNFFVNYRICSVHFSVLATAQNQIAHHINIKKNKAKKKLIIKIANGTQP